LQLFIPLMALCKNDIHSIIATVNENGASSAFIPAKYLDECARNSRIDLCIPVGLSELNRLMHSEEEFGGACEERLKLEVENITRLNRIVQMHGRIISPPRVRGLIQQFSDQHLSALILSILDTCIKSQCNPRELIEALYDNSQYLARLSVEETRKWVPVALALYVFETMLDVDLNPVYLRGSVTTGLGEGGKYVGVYFDVIRETLWISPALGTLNVKLSDEGCLLWRRISVRPIMVLAPPRENLGGVLAWPCVLGGQPSWVVRPEKTVHDVCTVEVISKFFLRSIFNLKDGEMVELIVFARR